MREMITIKNMCGVTHVWSYTCVNVFYLLHTVLCFERKWQNHIASFAVRMCVIGKYVGGNEVCKNLSFKVPFCQVNGTV